MAHCTLAGRHIPVCAWLSCSYRSRTGWYFSVAPRDSLGEKHHPIRDLASGLFCLILKVDEELLCGPSFLTYRIGASDPRDRVQVGFPPSESRGANGKPTCARFRFARIKLKIHPQPECSRKATNNFANVRCTFVIEPTTGFASIQSV